MKITNEAISEALLQLLRLDIAAQLPGQLVAPPAPLAREKQLQLISHAATLALSDAPEERSLAYEIAARIVETTSNDQSLIPAASFIMSRLGNFPGRQLVANRYASGAQDKPQHPLLDIESFAREMENTVHVAGESKVLTDFQMDFFELLENSDSASVSAPTSAGKSFVLSLGIIKKVSQNNNSNIVYVVPTRALLGQVTRSLLALLKKAQLSTPVRCVPIPLDPEAKSGCIYVLTQERLISLLQSFTKNQTINIMIVDEAQSVGDGSRGVLLQTAIESVRRLNPQVNIFFASPLTRNPGLLLDHFGTGVSKKILEEKHSPVLQNIILARDVHREVKQAEFFVLDDIGEHSIGRAVLSFKFRGTLSEIKSNFAKNVTKHNESAIIYCNTPSQTEETALEICSTSEDDADQDVYDFLEFIREHIHEEYSLINTLPKGVAYHYGSMPNIVRSRIEQLAKQGKLKYICCTSTLLQGINLPAKHIIIDRPRKGKTKPMGRADFLNLAGRAGRLLHEFQGNVWCLRPDTWDTPEGVSDPCFRGADTQDIKMSFFESLSNDGELLLNILRDSHSGDKESFELGVATICKLFSEFIIPGINLPSAYAKSPEAALILENLQNECKKTDFTIPKEILSLNPSVHPVRLQNLYNHMIQQNPIDLLPIYPQNKGANDRLKEIFRIISIYLEKEDNNSFKFDSWLANSWLHDTPLKSIIDQRITYLTQKAQRENKEPPVTKIEINSILDSLQQRIRFKYVKNIRAYKQILTHQLINTGKHKEAAEIIPIDLYLECGSSNPIILSLMGIGLTRTTALMLKGKVKFPDSPTPETCLGLLASTNITSLNIPGVCKNEIEELLSVGS